LGLKIAIADVNEEGLKTLAKELAVSIGEGNVLAVPTDVSKIDDVVRLRDKVYETWGEVRLRPERVSLPFCSSPAYAHPSTRP